jgi:hypothetical protein
LVGLKARLVTPTVNVSGSGGAITTGSLLHPSTGFVVVQLLVGRRNNNNFKRFVSQVSLEKQLFLLSILSTMAHFTPI